jgi:hypothetical protein
MTKRDRISVNIDSEIHKKLKKEAQERDISCEKLAEKLLSWYLRNNNISQESPEADVEDLKKIA